MQVAVPVIVVLAVIVFIVYAVIAKRKREKAMAETAAQQGWTALSNDTASLAPYLPQYIQMLGQQNYGLSGSFSRSHVSYDMAYRAAVANHSVVFFQYEYTEYNRNIDPNQPESSTTCYFTIVHATMPTSLPTVLLLHHTFLSKLVNFGLHAGLQKIDLEGNFNDSYDTYITPGGQVEALSLLTPDVMEDVMALAGSQKYVSMQLAGQAIAMSFENQTLTPEFIVPVLQQVATVLQKIDAKPR